MSYVLSQEWRILQLADGGRKEIAKRSSTSRGCFAIRATGRKDSQAYGVFIRYVREVSLQGLSERATVPLGVVATEFIKRFPMHCVLNDVRRRRRTLRRSN